MGQVHWFADGRFVTLLMPCVIRSGFRVSLLTVLVITLHAQTIARAEDGPVLAVSPAVVEWTLRASGRNGTVLRLANLSRETLAIEAAMAAWDLDEAGALVRLAPAPGAFAGRLEPAPRRLSLAAGERRALRLWLHDPEGLSAGEHRALLLLTARDEAGEVRLQLDLAVYAWLGAQREAARVESVGWTLCDGALRFHLAASNRGDRYVRAEGWLVIGQGGTATRLALPRTPILPGRTLSLALDADLASPDPPVLGLEGRLGPVVLDGLDPGPPQRCEAEPPPEAGDREDAAALADGVPGSGWLVAGP
jgi:hypothetical protein